MLVESQPGALAPAAGRGRDNSDAKACRPIGRGRTAWLGFLALLVLVGHLFLVLRHQTPAQLGITVICWYAVGVLVLRKSPFLLTSGSLATTLLGGLALVWTGFHAWAFDGSQRNLIYLYPMAGGGGLVLVAAGFAGLRYFWRELLILFCLGVPRGFLSHAVDLSLPTAHVATLVLWYLGRDVRLMGTEIVLPGGSVNVDKTCDGTGVIAYLLCLGVVFVFVFPVGRRQRLIALVAAPLLAFITNLTRIVTLALLEQGGRHDRFDYWHEGHGSLLWTVLPVTLFAGLALVLLPRPARTTANP